VRVPEEAGSGLATVTLSFPGWAEGGAVAPFTFRVRVTDPLRQQ
jgi:hypothetical protein